MNGGGRSIGYFVHVDERKVLLARMTVFTPRGMGCLFFTPR